MNYFDTLFAKKYGVGGGSMFATLFGKSLGGDTPAPVMPSKGDVIAVDMNGDGTAENYLVLKVNGTVAEVLGRYNANSNVKYGSSNTYQNSSADNSMNNDFYNTLSATAKDAIVDKTFRQDSWYRDNTGSPAYNAKWESSYQSTDYVLSLNSDAFGDEITRHCYLLSTQDIVDYLEATPEMTAANTTLTTDNISNMFGILTSSVTWLRSAGAGGPTTRVMGVTNDIYQISNQASTNQSNYCMRPAFQLDLTKIEWSPVEA